MYGTEVQTFQLFFKFSFGATAPHGQGPSHSRGF
jgi:hypothetical protein